jgi:hypothetical protein
MGMGDVNTLMIDGCILVSQTAPNSDFRSRSSGSSEVVSWNWDNLPNWCCHLCVYSYIYMYIYSIIKLIREWISNDDPAGGFNIQPYLGWWSPMTKIFQGVQPPTNTHSIVPLICSLQINTWLGWVDDTVGYSNGIDIGAVFQPLGAGS